MPYFASRTALAFIIMASLSAFSPDAVADEPSAIDYAQSLHVDDWIRSPALGDPSFDSFVRLPNNPIHRGKTPYEWPVNGFFFPDPISGNWYVFVGDYTRGYIAIASRCLLYRSKDKGTTWENLGVVLAGDAKMFDGDGKTPGHTPDVSVVFDKGRYHMVYDWGIVSPPMTEGGLAYAWADKPEGPWHRDPEPIQRRATEPVLAGRYNRPYGGTLIRRKNDWLIVSMMDHAPASWAFYAKTAKDPQGPYSPSVLMRNVEQDSFMPPVMEGFPAFVHEGFVYFPTTSVADNREFNVVFRAPIEQADQSSAWEIYRYGSVWHSEPVENEAWGIWGQTFSGQVLADGGLTVMFPSRDASGMGTINMATRPWNQPLRERGFVLSGESAPSFTCLRQGYDAFKLDVALQLRGTVTIVWDYAAPMGPHAPQAGAHLNPIMSTRHHGLKLTDSAWSIYEANETGGMKTLASGAVPKSETWNLSLTRDPAGKVSLSAGDKPLWNGEIQPTPGGSIGLMTAAHSWTDVDHFSIAGTAAIAQRFHFYTEALLGAGESIRDWSVTKSNLFHFGEGALSKKPNPRVKWNVIGTSLQLYSPKGPDYGKVEVLLDGQSQGIIDLHGDQPTPSVGVWSAHGLKGIYHAVVLRTSTGTMPVDCLQVTD